MKKLLPLFGVFLLSSLPVVAQFTTEGRPITGSTAMPVPAKVSNRSAQKPTACKSDTTTYARFGTTAYNSVTVKTGSSLGQFFPVPQSMTVSGFYFYAFSLSTTPARPVNIRLRCNIYKAGADSLPSGAPLATDTVTVDTVMGSSILLSRIMRKAVFKTPVTFTSGGYIIAVECDSSAVSAAVITNSWTAGDGGYQNLGCGSVSGKWYRCLSLNINKVTFNSNMQYYPFIKYNFGTDFTVDNNCYNTADTVRFTNTNKTNVSGSVFYNFYIYYGLEQYSHRWTYDGIYSQYAVNGKYKPATKKNFKTQLISTVYSYSSGQCYDTAEKMVYFKPNFPSTKKLPNACRGDTTTIDIITDAGVTVKWFKQAKDTIPFFTGYSYTVKNVQKNDTFFVSAENGPCKSNLARILLFMNEYPNKPTIKNDSLCSGATANLGASTNIGNVEWYKNTSGGLMFYSGNLFQTGKLTNDTEYYVQANNAGCYSKGGRVKVKAFVGSSFAPEKPNVMSDTSVCFRPAKTIQLAASQTGSDTLRWFNTSTGGKPLATGSTFSFNPANRGDVDYFVETWNGICGSGRSQITVHVKDYPTIFGLTGDTICKGDSAFPYLSVPWGNVNWYAKKSDNKPVFTGKRPAFGGLTADKTYYMEAEESGCVNANRDSVKINVNAPPVPTSVKADPVCAKGIGSMNVNIPAGKVNWFYDTTDLTPFYTGSTIGTGMLLSNLTYYYSTENKGCVSDKKPLTITIKPRPVAGFTWSLQWQNKLVCTPITTTGLTISWEWGDGKTQSGAPNNHVYANSGNYTVRMVATSTTNGCKDTADIPVIVSHVGTQILTAGDLKLYPVPARKGGILHVDGVTFTASEFELFSSDGRKVKAEVNAGGEILIPENLPMGIYTAVIHHGGKIMSASILITE